MSPKMLLIVVAVVIVGSFFGLDLTPLLTGGGGTTAFAPPSAQQSRALSPEEGEAGRFAAVVLADTEEIWAEVFRDQLGREYRAPTLVLFSGMTRSPCGMASAATGPFYCPADRKAYLDTAFFAVLSRRLGATGDFAQASVIAHEVGHHVQNELGVLSRANEARASLPAAEANAVSVRIELMADCFSGLWARLADARFDTLEPGDLDEAINAAGRIGDDVLQAGAGRAVRPDSFTHGTAEQRQRWFRTGWENPRVEACDTFAAERL